MIKNVLGCAMLVVISLLVMGISCSEPSVLEADFVADVFTGEAPLIVEFTDLSESGDAQITSWLWTFGDGQESDEQNPQHVYQNAGTYDVSLTVTTSDDVDTKLAQDYIVVAEGNQIEYFRDDDGDGYGQDDDSVMASAPEAPYTVTVGGDCDDDDGDISPDATEICNGIDDNCDGQIDENIDFDTDPDNCGDCGIQCPEGQTCSDGLCTREYFRDDDEDGYGLDDDYVMATGPVAPYTATVDGDCNDGVASMHPGATEICDNFIDDDCNGIIDDHCH